MQPHLPAPMTLLVIVHCTEIFQISVKFYSAPNYKES